MRLLSMILLRPLIFLMFFNDLIPGHGQGKEESLFVVSDSMTSVFVGLPTRPMFNRELIVEVWNTDYIENEIGYFGLRYTPNMDQNVYLTYNYEINSNQSRAMLGVSLNNFATLNVKFIHLFSLEEFINK